MSRIFACELGIMHINVAARPRGFRVGTRLLPVSTRYTSGNLAPVLHHVGVRMTSPARDEMALLRGDLDPKEISVAREMPINAQENLKKKDLKSKKGGKNGAVYSGQSARCTRGAVSTLRREFICSDKRLNSRVVAPMTSAHMQNCR